MMALWLASTLLVGVTWGLLTWTLRSVSLRLGRLSAELNAAFDYLRVLEGVYRAAQSALAAGSGKPAGPREGLGQLATAVARAETFEIGRLPSYRPDSATGPG